MKTPKLTIKTTFWEHSDPDYYKKKISNYTYLLIMLAGANIIANPRTWILNVIFILFAMIIIRSYNKWKGTRQTTTT